MSKEESHNQLSVPKDLTTRTEEFLRNLIILLIQQQLQQVMQVMQQNAAIIAISGKLADK